MYNILYSIIHYCTIKYKIACAVLFYYTFTGFPCTDLSEIDLRSVHGKPVIVA